jgi:DNA-binding transcriptional LysR family regulator
MTLTELKYIVAVARERHFGRAAEACFVSQPTLSVAIKKLEDELGVQLFERGSTEVSITPIGGQIVEQAQRVLEESSAIKEIAKQGRDPLSGPLAPRRDPHHRPLPAAGSGAENDQELAEDAVAPAGGADHQAAGVPETG